MRIDFNRITKALDAADPKWPEKLRPNLTGSERLLFLIHDIALERKQLEAEVLRLRKEKA